MRRRGRGGTPAARPPIPAHPPPPHTHTHTTTHLKLPSRARRRGGLGRTPAADRARNFRGRRGARRAGVGGWQPVRRPASPLPPWRAGAATRPPGRPPSRPGPPGGRAGAGRRRALRQSPPPSIQSLSRAAAARHGGGRRAGWRWPGRTAGARLWPAWLNTRARAVAGRCLGGDRRGKRASEIDRRGRTSPSGPPSLRHPAAPPPPAPPAPPPPHVLVHGCVPFFWCFGGRPGGTPRRGTGVPVPPPPLPP